MATKDLNYDVAENHGHVPVMRERMADLLRPQVEAAGDKAVLVDATLGAGVDGCWSGSPAGRPLRWRRAERTRWPRRVATRRLVALAARRTHSEH